MSDPANPPINDIIAGAGQDSREPDPVRHYDAVHGTYDMPRINKMRRQVPHLTEIPDHQLSVFSNMKK